MDNRAGESVPREGPRLDVLDGLRGVAILLVLFRHSYLTNFRPGFDLGTTRISIDPAVFGGSLGVELFFFLSGFVLFYPYARAALGLRPAPTLAHYADRRFIKIVPSYAIALLGISAVFALSADDSAGRWWQLLTHLTFTHAFFSGTMFGISSPFWSVGIEVEFYIVFPLFAAAMMRRPYLTYAGMALVAIAYRGYLHVAGLHADFFLVSQLPAQLDLFGTGMLSSYAFSKYYRTDAGARVRVAATATAILGAAAGIWLLIDLSAATGPTGSASTQQWQNDHRFFVSLAIAATALGTLFGSRWWSRIVALPPLLWFSTISYNLYLWHDAIFDQCRQTGFPCAGQLSPWTSMTNWDRQFFIGFFAVSIIVATFVTFGVERPLLRMGTRGAFDRFVRGPLGALRNRKAGEAQAA